MMMTEQQKVNERKKKYRNSEKGKLTEKRYYLQHKKEIYKKRKKWRNSEKGKISEKRYRQSEKRKNVLKKYEKSEKGKIASVLKTLRHEEKKVLGKSPKISRIDYIKIFELFNNKCFNCEIKERLCLEHHKPLISGYSIFHNGFNASVLCNSCNTHKKRKKMPEMFYSKEKLNEYEKIKKRWLACKKGDTNTHTQQK